MYLLDLKIRNLKLLKDFHLSFSNADGSPRMWTVLVGENGTGKTSILQAIALAAAGPLQVNRLATNVETLRDRRTATATMAIDARFVLDPRLSDLRDYPGLPDDVRPADGVPLVSRLELPPGRKSLIGAAYYDIADTTQQPSPLDEARSTDASLWFVAAYGIHRSLPRDATSQPPLSHPSIDRLEPLFGSVDLIGTAFANILRSPKGTMFANVLRDTLFGEQGLLPLLVDLEMRGRGGAADAVALQERHRFIQRTPRGPLKLAASWLSHGYQSTIAWIADLVGQILWESRSEDGLPSKEMEGLVLIDEIDLYLHPAWQRTLIRALKATFPRLQFVVSTHSPLTLVGLRPDVDEIVRLGFDPASGDVTAIDLKHGQPHEPDPRLMTGTELYRGFFGIDRFYPGDLGDLLRDHRFLAANPSRTADEEDQLDVIEAKLRAEGVEPDFPREPRT